jgi:hypothetical protein
MGIAIPVLPGLFDERRQWQIGIGLRAKKPFKATVNQVDRSTW